MPPKSSSSIRLFPHSLPDETFASRASRYHWEAGGQNTTDTCHALFGRMPGRLTQIIPQHLWPLSEKLIGNPSDNLKQFLNKNTLYPICSLFYGLDHGTLEDRSSISRLHLPRRTFSLPDTKICLLCVCDDFKGHGIPYLHRSHQIPGVRVCHRHALPLLDHCPYCACPFEKNLDLFTVPWRPCKCGRMLMDMPIQEVSLDTNHVAVRYAAFAHDLLNMVSFTATSQEISETYRYRLNQLGFSRGKGISHTASMQAIEKYYGENELSELDKAYKEGKHDQWLRLIHTEIRPQEVPISRHILLANFLFNAADAYLDELKNVRGRTNRMNERLRLAPGNIAGKAPFDKYVQKILQTINDNPDFSMKDLWKKLPGTLARLLKLAPEEFEKLQAALYANPQKTIIEQKSITTNTNPKYQETDRENADLLKQAATRLYASSQKPERVTKTAMLRKAKLEYRHLNAERFPLSQQIVDEYTESAWHFWARRYMWALVHTDSNAGAMEVWKLSGIHMYHYRELAPLFSNLKMPSQLRDGQITAILGGMGIGHKWVGPCPDKVIIGGGRAYQKMTSFPDNPPRSPSKIKSQKSKKTVKPSVQLSGKAVHQK